MSDAASNHISELKVSGHTMALDPGLYCVFNAQGSPKPSAQTGLPAVRISAAPGPVAGMVEVVGMNSGGWVGPESAVLVRVAGARSHVLVTVYQSKDAKAEAPALQVVRISEAGDAAAGAPEAPVEKVAAPADAKADAKSGRAAPDAAVMQEASRGQQEISVIAHIYGRGDVGGQVGAWIGEMGSKRWIEGFGVAPVRDVPASDLEYQAVLGRGWLSPWSQGGQFCGSRNMSLPILGLRVRLRGASAGTHQVRLSATFIDGSQVGPVGDGEPCEAESLAALESFLVVIEARGVAVGKAPAAAAGKSKAKGAAVSAKAVSAKAVPAKGGPKAANTKVAIPKAAIPKAANTKAANTKAGPTKAATTKAGPTQAAPAKAASAKAASAEPAPAKVGAAKVAGRTGKGAASNARPARTPPSTRRR